MTLVDANPRLVYRALLPTGLLAVLWFAAAYNVRSYPGMLGAIVLAAISVARAAFWARGFAQRSLKSTESHLILCKGEDVEQWIAWAEVEGLTVWPSDPAPEWSRSGTHWFSVIPRPELKVMPPAASLGGFNEMLVSYRASQAATERVCREADQRAIPHDVM